MRGRCAGQRLLKEAAREANHAHVSQASRPNDFERDRIRLPRRCSTHNSQSEHQPIQGCSAILGTRRTAQRGVTRELQLALVIGARGEASRQRETCDGRPTSADQASQAFEELTPCSIL